MSPKKRTNSKKEKKKAENTYDLWDEDPNPAAELDKTDGEFHRLRQTGKLKPKPKPAYVHSVLPSIEVAKAGASYNPSADDYIEYANQIAAEETAISKSEERAKRKMQLRSGDSYITAAEAEREELMGFWVSDEEDGADIKSDAEIKTEPSSDDEKAVARVHKKAKPKTQKQRRKELERRLVELERIKTKRTKRQEAEFNRVKSILKEVNKDLKERADVAAHKRRKRILRRLTATKRLGHGKFEEFAEPVLLPHEIKGSLRTVKPQGNIFKERVRSFQKRNMMQPPSFKKAKTLKTTLKFKVGEKRAVQEYMEGEKAKLRAANVI